MIRILPSGATRFLGVRSVPEQQRRLIAGGDIAAVLHEGTQVLIATCSKRNVTGGIPIVALNGVVLETDARETQVPLKEIDRLGRPVK